MGSFTSHAPIGALVYYALEEWFLFFLSFGVFITNGRYGSFIHYIYCYIKLYYYTLFIIICPKLGNNETTFMIVTVRACVIINACGDVSTDNDLTRPDLPKREREMS